MSTPDRLLLTGVRAHGHHGVYDDERRDGQEFVVDVAIELDLSLAASGDALAETIHYGELAEELVAAIERDPVDLIETLAERLAGAVLAHRPAQAVEVTVHKPHAPITVPFGDVAVSIRRGWTVAVVALGANLGDREATIRQAVLALATHSGIRLRKASPLVETPALRTDGVDEAAPQYLNAVVEIDTTLTPFALLRALHEIEDAHDRRRDVRWGDRTLDLDLVMFGRDRIAGSDLTVPHPRAHERAFVLAPWAAMDEAAVLPGRGRVVDLLDRVLAETGERVEAYPSEPLA